MMPLLVRVPVPPDEFRMTPAAGRPKGPEPPVRPACQPPITDTPDAMLTATLPPVIATIPLLNSPVVLIGPEGSHIDAAAARLCKDPDAVPALDCNARTGVIHNDWRIRTAIKGSNTDR